MKIACIGQKGIPMTQGGVEAHVENLAIEMAKKGHDIYVYTRPYYTDKKLKEYKGVNLISLPSIKTKHLDAISHTFFSTIHALFQNYDIIHYHSVGPSILSFIPKLFSKAKIIGTFHCMDRFHEKWNKFAKLILKLGEWTICKFPHITIAVSKHIKDYCFKKHHKNCVFIPSGFKIKKDLNINKLEKFNIKPRKYFLTVSRLIKHKGIQYLIKAFNKLQPVFDPEAQTQKKAGQSMTVDNDEYQLVIVGDTFYNKTYSDYIKNLAKDNKNIILTGQQNNSALNQLFSNAFCFIIPSEGEGLSITLLEAMAHGLPIVASEIQGNKVFIEKNLVYSFKNKDIDDLNEKIIYIIYNQEKALKKAREAQKYVEKNFSWSYIADKIEKVYKNILK